MNPEEWEDFVRLTENALAEDDPDKFVLCLLKRGRFVAPLLKNDPEVLGTGTKKRLARETRVLERLEKERSRVIEAMDKLSKSRKNLHFYASKFPFPPMPVLFDTMA